MTESLEPLIYGTLDATLGPLETLHTMTIPTKVTTPPDPSTTLSILGPLPTAFTPSADCFAPKPLLDGVYGGSCRAAAAAVTATAEVVLASTCYPSGLAGKAATYSWTSAIPAYSPASDCPAQFTAACSVARRSDQQPSGLNPAEASVWSALALNQTMLGCCPSCVGPSTTGSVTPQAYGFYSSSSSQVPCQTGSTAAYATQSHAARVNLIQGRAIRNASTSGSRGRTAVEAGDPGVAPELLDPSAKIAIGVCVPVVCIAAGIFFFLLWRKRRRQKKQKEEVEDEDVVEGKAELESKNVKAPIPMQEMDAVREAQEVPLNEKRGPVEAPGNTVLAELPGDYEANRQRGEES
ncbi:hypothetical protein FE257_012782 [Aspergillus nanangensis]|uniref:Uncharacterized protein n=1 Tax=Aspergillus nanangensis TaxID=2582783 RepID=A0AAD4CFI5_ASPNN|nr:hypothetical protein FE257_012782 [Aspergillus nanangensis]